MTTEELATFRTEKMDGFIDAWLASVKLRCGYEIDVTAYDDEIRELMESAVMDMLTAGVPEDLFVTDNLDKRILNALALYVQAYIEQDRSDTNRYTALYKRVVFKLSLEDGGGWDVEPDD
jgi:hypothetical protein